MNIRAQNNIALSREKQALITKSVSGNSPSITGGWIKGLTIYKSVQNGTPDPNTPVVVNGAVETLRYKEKNLIPYPYPSINNTSNGITWTVNIDGILSNGTATANSYFTLSYAGFYAKWSV